MNVSEHLLTCLAEEAAEVGQDVAKCLRFGVDDRNILNPTGPSNKERLIVELNQMLAVIHMLINQGVLPADWINYEVQQEKCAKVIQWMEYSRSKGTLS